MSASPRAMRMLFIGSTLALCWLTMQVVHELGHVVAAQLTGGKVTQVVLSPLKISRTDVRPNPAPGVVVWCGPLVGTLLPAVVWLVVRHLRLAWAYLVRFWMGFCLVANGAYIGAGVITPVGDAQTMLQTGSPTWLLAFFGCATFGLGLWSCNGLGPHFGLGVRADSLQRRHVVGVLVMLAATVLLELIWV